MGDRYDVPTGCAGRLGADHLNIATPEGERRYDEVLRFGYGADLHYADTSTTNDAFRQGDQRLMRAIDVWNEADVEFAMMAGDYVDGDHGAAPQAVFDDMAVVEELFEQLDAERHYALGNHDLDVLTKAQFAAHTAMDETYYSFDAGGFHFVVVDPNYTAFDDGADYASGDFSHLDIWLNPTQLEWLADDLRSTSLPTIVFTHQRLARQGGDFAENAADVRRVFAEYGDVRAVFSSHAHENENTAVDGIHYFCMAAMVEGSVSETSFAVVRLYEDNYVYVEGFGGQDSYLREL